MNIHPAAEELAVATYHRNKGNLRGFQPWDIAAFAQFYLMTFPSEGIVLIDLEESDRIFKQVQELNPRGSMPW